MNLKNKKVAILGLGIEGKDLVKFLLAEEADITVLDKKPLEDLDLEGVDSKKVKFENGSGYLKNLSSFEIIFRSPGVYRNSDEIKSAERKGILVSSALKLFLEFCPAPIIGVTGTKGKGTTSTLIYQILKDAGKDVYLGGNIGSAYLELLNKLKKTSIVVLEMSSFQLIDADKSPHIAVVLNITSDHMDWHKDINEYVTAKENIVKFQNKNDYAVINRDYEVPNNFDKKTKAKVYYFSKNQYLNKGCFVQDGEIVFNDGKILSTYGNRYGLNLRGDHNVENVTAAITVAKILGVSDDTIKTTILSFKGLEHRLELVSNIGGVTFFNDSFATGPQPTIAAIKSFTEPTTVILGGSEKFLDYDELGEVVAKSKNVINVVLIGNIGKKIGEAIGKTIYKGKILNLEKSKMPEIVKEAFKITPKGGVVLLSPAAASFDMFKNYKERGNKFKEAVNSLV